MALKYPFGAATTVALTATGAQAISISNNYTILDGVTVEATGNRTLNLTIDSEVTAGAKIYVKAKTNGTETTIAGTGITMATTTGAAGKTKCFELVYNGTVFTPTALAVQID